MLRKAFKMFFALNHSIELHLLLILTFCIVFMLFAEYLSSEVQYGAQGFYESCFRSQSTYGSC